MSRDEEARRVLDRHDDVVQGLTAIRWALEAGDHERAKEAARLTLAQAQAIACDLLAGRAEGAAAPGSLRRRAPSAHRP